MLMDKEIVLRITMRKAFVFQISKYKDLKRFYQVLTK